MKILNKLFDKIYLITMKDSSRTEGALKKLKDVDFEIFWGINGGEMDHSYYRDRGSKLTKGQMGCAKSHIELYNTILEKNYKNTLILEDDFTPNDNFKLLENIFNQLPSNYGLFYLGHYNCFSNNIFSQNLIEISQNNFSYLHGTHAYSIQPSVIKVLIEANKDLNYTADGILSKVIKGNIKAYATSPSLIDQDLSLGSDMVNLDIKYN